MNRSKVLVVGDALIDRYVYVKTTRKSPEDPSIDVWDVIDDNDILGGALNVAANVKSLLGNQVDVAFAGILPVDQPCWQEHGLDLYENTNHAVIWTTAPLIKERLIDTATGRQITRIDHGAKFDDYDTLCFRSLFRDLDLEQFDAIVVSDYNKGTVNEKVIERLGTYQGLKLIDTKKSDLSIWQPSERCVIKINERENAKAQRFENANVIVTTGADGSSLYRPGKEVFRLRGASVPDADCIGAGDAYLAGLTAGMHNLRSLELAMVYADRVARASVRQKGTTVVFQQQVNQEKFPIDQQASV